MKKLLTQFLGLTLGCLLVNTGFAQLAATESSDANELIELFLNDNGNLSYSNASLIGAEGAAGTYTGANFDETEGVILATGMVADAAGPNNAIATTTVNGTSGDEDLELLADKSTNDAVSLSADFVPVGSTISFSYTFASEDYTAYVCSPFSDVMAVFVDGGEYDNQNVALVPSTDLLVTSNTINDGNAGDVWGENGCPEGGLNNSALYVDNDGGLNYEYNGRTVVLSGEIAVTPGQVYNIRWVIADGNDALFDSALLLEAGSLSSSESDCTAIGGELTVDGPTTVCKSDGIDDNFTLNVEGAAGENQVFVATLLNGQILLITEDSEINLEGIPGNGVCLFWSLSWDGEITGAEVGLNAFDIEGECFELSNSVEITEYFTDGGEIGTNDPTTICALDGISDPINVTLTGETGENMAWVITDADLNILDLPAGPPFDLEGAGEGLCIIWHLSWSGELNGAAVGENAGNLSGDCFDLSNPIEVTRYVADGGEISTDDPTTICALDGVADPINVTLTGETGENMAWVITDADLNILDLPAGPPFDLEGAGEGLCIIWHLSWSGELNGAAVGENAGNLSGDCFDLSNPIEVNREECCTAEGGTLTVDGPSPVCKSDGEDDIFTLSVDGAVGENQTFVATFTDGEIILITNNTQLNLEGFPGNQACLFWHLSWDGEIEGAQVGLNAFDITGDCFDLSNSVEVIEYFTNGGEISTEDPTTICALDGVSDPINVTLEGAEGENMAWVITDADLNILDLPAGPPFDLEGAGVGVCLIWHLSWSGELNGAAVGENAGDLSGDCFDLSNPIEVTRYVADGGEISTDDPTTICALDGVADPINVALTGETGENMAWVITDADLNILDLPAGPPFDLEGAGEGLCIIWHLSWSGELNGAVVGENAGDLSGDCFDLSNPIEVTRYVADGGEISTDDPTTICALDGVADPINVTLTGETGENMAWVITDADLNILDLPDGPPFDLEGAGEGLCIIWHLSWSGELNGAAVGENAGDLSGDCFDLSNPIEVTRYVADGGEISTDDPTTICVGDGIGDPIDVTLTGETGESMAWVITDADLNILDLPAGPPFDLEGAGVGVCLIWHLSWTGELNGAAVGENAGNLTGDCFDLSNPIEVNREECDDCTAVGGELTVDGPTTVCKSDGVDDNFTLVVTGNEGENQAYVVTWLDGEIILISENPEFNLEGIPGNGTCLFWSLSWDGEIEGAEVGLNANDLAGDCFELSNPVPVTEYFTNGGEISTNDDTTICVGDGIPDPIDVTLVGDQGQNMAWVITDADLNILDLPAGPPFDLEGAGTGVCLIWNLSWSGEIEGAMIGANAANLSGDCFELSNSIAVERNTCVPFGSNNSWDYVLSMAPNPTEGEARVSYSSNQDSQTTIAVYNLNGQRVEVLLDQNTEAGVKYMLPFDGNSLPSGIYMYQISNGKEVKMQRFVIAR
ncbi:MAG: hypothetical protein ACJAQ4_001425 [Cryomorphaceae bacterium]|jgi:uncharacterized protein (DUF427 family)